MKHHILCLKSSGLFPLLVFKDQDFHTISTSSALYKAVRHSTFMRQYVDDNYKNNTSYHFFNTLSRKRNNDKTMKNDNTQTKLAIFINGCLERTGATLKKLLELVM